VAKQIVSLAIQSHVATLKQKCAYKEKEGP